MNQVSVTEIPVAKLDSYERLLHDLMEALNHFRDATDILDACENGTDSILDDVRRLA